MDKLTKISLGEPTAVKPTKIDLTTPSSPKKIKLLIPAIVLAVIMGTTLGIFFAKKHSLLADSGKTTNILAQNPADASEIEVGKVFGNSDEQTFRDSAEGIIQPGGIDGEGSHHLVRGADTSQWVYLTSSIVDLDNFVGTKVTIWGETVGAKKAGWLMDVGRLKILELNAAEIDVIEPVQ